MPNTVNVSLSVNGLAGTIQRLEMLKQETPVMMNELCRRLAERGAEIAQMAFNAVPESDVSVTALQTDNGYVISANGEKVCFIEFGTGVEAIHPQGHEFGMTEDTWSETHKQIFHTKGYWYYRKEKLTGTPAYMCMYATSEELSNLIGTIADEVFA